MASMALMESETVTGTQEVCMKTYAEACWDKYKNKKVVVKRAPHDHCGEIEGILEGFDGNALFLKIREGTVAINAGWIAEVKLR